MWYSDKLALALAFARIEVYFSDISSIEHTLEYHPDPANIFLIASKVNVDTAMAFFHEKVL